MKKTVCKLEDIAKVIVPQTGISLIVKKVPSGEILFDGPAHYLTGGESFCKKAVKSLAVAHDNEYISYVIEVSR